MFAGVNGTWPDPNTSLTAYSTLVPISPYTTPMAPSVSAASDDLELCTDHPRALGLTGFRYFWERYCAPEPDQAIGGETPCCDAATCPWQPGAGVACGTTALPRRPAVQRRREGADAETRYPQDPQGAPKTLVFSRTPRRRGWWPPARSWPPASPAGPPRRTYRSGWARSHPGARQAGACGCCVQRPGAQSSRRGR